MRSILIVDDNDSVAEMFAYLFAGQAWRVTWYSDGQRAGEALGGRVHYDAVLVGYRFEGIDGVDLITRIRALDHRKDVPIVMMTGTVDMALLVATVSKCVGGGRRHQEDT